MDITKATVGNVDNLIGMGTSTESGSPSKHRSKNTTGAAGSRGNLDDPEDEKGQSYYGAGREDYCCLYDYCCCCCCFNTITTTAATTTAY